MALSNPCKIVDALSRWQYDAVRGINRKFAQLQRTAELLAQLGDLSTLVPNIAALIPVADINFSSYNELAAMCPALGLPFPGEAPINELRAKVVGAYGNLVRNVLNHPYTRMGNLQGQLNSYLNRIGANTAVASDYLACLQAACDAIDDAAGQFEGITKAGIENELAKFSSGYLANAGEVLSGPYKTKNEQAKLALSQLGDLGAEVRQPFSTAKAAMSSTVASSDDTTTSSSGRELTDLPYVS